MKYSSMDGKADDSKPGGLIHRVNFYCHIQMKLHWLIIVTVLFVAGRLFVLDVEVRHDEAITNQQLVEARRRMLISQRQLIESEQALVVKETKLAQQLEMYK